MYIHGEKKVAFIAHPRTASVAMAATLLGSGFVQDGSHHQFRESSCLETTFSVVRNPFDMLVSWYYFRRREEHWSFEYWLRIFLNNPPHYISHGLFFGQHLCTDILHYENLQEEFDQLMKKVGLPQTKIKRMNVSEWRMGRDFMGIYNDATLDMVGRFFGDEIEQHNYWTRSS